MLKKILKRWRWIVAGLGALLIATLLTCWLLFQHRPAWYQPVQIPPDKDIQQRVRDDLEWTFQALNETLNAAQKPFQFRITQNQVNAWLAGWDLIDPRSRQMIPPQFTEPMVVFEADGVRVAATYTFGEKGNLRTIVSAKLKVEADAQGVTVRLDDISGGSLSLPRTAVREGLKSLGGRLSAELARAGVSTPRGSRPRLTDLLEGITIPNTGKWPGGGQRFRIIGVAFEPGALVLTIERLRHQERSRR